MKKRYPFLISVPHGGTEIPADLRNRFALTEAELLYYCDPETRLIFGFRDHVAAYIDTKISRMVTDLNRPPLPLPGRDPDGIIKVRTIDGKDVYRPGQFPDMQTIHRLMMAHYFPYHQRIDELIDKCPVEIAFDCHSMLPVGSCGQNDAGKGRPLICLGNNGNRHGRAKKGSIATCRPEMIEALAGAFRDTFAIRKEVAINNPFSGGFIANAHYWRKGIPWIQIEVNRSLYENSDTSGGKRAGPDPVRIRTLRGQVWKALTLFWDDYR
ncbi:MAG: N-formylglutamate amidohydrolase [Methanoregula sp. PtaU1.Bin051]|nr:MAG: N-formylglutamate amidohydrolase [Methanoregula sp. PtaU1.Bin051]